MGITEGPSGTRALDGSSVPRIDTAGQPALNRDPDAVVAPGRGHGLLPEPAPLPHGELETSAPLDQPSQLRTSRPGRRCSRFWTPTPYLSLPSSFSVTLCQ